MGGKGNLQVWSTALTKSCRSMGGADSLPWQGVHSLTGPLAAAALGELPRPRLP